MSGAEATRNTVIAFVLAFPGERFCAKCLASRIGTEVYGVREALASGTDWPEVIVDKRTCSACRRVATVAKARPQ